MWRVSCAARFSKRRLRLDLFYLLLFNGPHA
jgi:hypothetical protein